MAILCVLRYLRRAVLDVRFEKQPMVYYIKISATSPKRPGGGVVIAVFTTKIHE